MGLSLNAAANIVFEEYLQVHLPAQKVGLAYVPKPMIQELLRETPEGMIPLIVTKAMLPGLQSVMCMTQKTLDSNAMVSTILTVAKCSGYTYSDILVPDGSRIVTLFHDMGIKYSMLMKACLEHALDDLSGQSDIQCTISESRVTLNIRN